MNWIPITASDLNAAKVAALVNALRTAALGQGQSDPVDEIISSVVTRIRAEVQGCPRNQVDADTAKIPASLKLLASRLIIAAAKNRLEIPLKDDERDAIRSDERYLERIARCEIPIEEPENPLVSTVQKSGGISVVSSTRRKATRQTMRGL